MTDEQKIIEVINQLRPYLNSDGGDIEYLKYEDNYVYIKLFGACAACQFKDYTIEDNILQAIKEKVPDVKDIINVEIWYLVYHIFFVMILITYLY